MKNSSELREEARNNLSDKWGSAVLVALIYFGVSFAINMIGSFIPFSSILLLVITIPFSFGITISFLKLKRNDNFSYGSIFTETFNNFTKIWSIIGNMCLKLMVPIIILVISIIIFVISTIIPIFLVNSSSDDLQIMSYIFSIIFMFVGLIVYFTGITLFIVKYYYYCLSPYLLYDNPNMTGKEIVELSESLMKDQRGNFFILQLSFIGWAILSLFTCGIGTLFLIPYINFAEIAFYEDRNGTVTIENKSENTNN